LVPPGGGGGTGPGSASPTVSASTTSSATPSASPTPEVTPSATPTPSGTPTPTATTTSMPSPTGSTTPDNRIAVNLLPATFGPVGGDDGTGHGKAEIAFAVIRVRPGPQPQGTITIFDSGIPITTMSLSPVTGYGPTDVGIDWTGVLSLGRHDITTTYSGDDLYQPGLGSLDLELPNAQVQVTVPAQARSGQPYSIRVKVTPLPGVTGVPTGTVHLDDVSDAGTPIDASGSATLTATAPPLGGTEPVCGYPYQQFVWYSGDSTFTGTGQTVDAPCTIPLPH
jgi:hypothetical protein